MIRFAFDGDTRVFTAHGRASHWNGWLRPMVDRDTLVAVVDRMNERDTERRTELRWRGGEALIREVDRVDGTELWQGVMSPNADGRYLLDMGLTLAEVD
jgi:hypothetical protein